MRRLLNDEEGDESDEYEPLLFALHKTKILKWVIGIFLFLLWAAFMAVIGFYGSGVIAETYPDPNNYSRAQMGKAFVVFGTFIYMAVIGGIYVIIARVMGYVKPKQRKKPERRP